MSSSISVIINTLNAQAWLDYALRSVEPWAGEIVVVDMHSEDRTQEIARAHGARVLLHERTGYVEPARAFAVAQAAHEWVLILDADEMVPEPLSRRLCEISAQGAVDAVRLPRLNHILGAAIMHSGWGPHQDRHVRFFRRGRVELPTRIHGAIKPLPGARVLEIAAVPDLAIVHFNFNDTSDIAARIDRYTTIEAATARARGDRARPGRALARAVAEFVNRYVILGGWRDGWRGVYLAAWMANYRVMTDAKLMELQLDLRSESIESGYRRVAEGVLLGHKRARSSGAHVPDATDRTRH